MVRLITLKPISYGGKRLKAGIPFDAPDKQARILKAMKAAKDYDPATYFTTSVPKAAPPPPAPVEAPQLSAAPDDSTDETQATAKRTYKRRDVVAE